MHRLLPENPGIQSSIAEGEVVSRRSFGRVLHKHFKPRVVCQTCNNTWMSRMETAVKPTLLPLMLREARHLTREDQVTLTTWALLKNMVAEFSDPTTRATGPADFDRMRDRQLPPARAVAWIGEHVGSEWSTRYRHHGMRIAHGPVKPCDEPPLNGHATTIGVGCVVFHILMLPEGFLYDGPPLPTGRIATRIKQIHPKPSPFDWPLSAKLTDADTLDLGDTMTHVYKGLVERPLAQRA